MESNVPDLIRKNKKLNYALLDLLLVLNTDDDGDYFICKEASDIVGRAYAAVDRKAALKRIEKITRKAKK